MFPVITRCRKMQTCYGNSNKYRWCWRYWNVLWINGITKFNVPQYDTLGRWRDSSICWSFYSWVRIRYDTKCCSILSCTIGCIRIFTWIQPSLESSSVTWASESCISIYTITKAFVNVAKLFSCVTCI